MTYRLDDEGAFDKRRVGAGNEAVGAVDRAGQWCAHELTDGIFPHDMALSIAPQKVWDKAALHRLVEKLPDGSLRVCDYSQWNWSAERVLQQREADRRRQTKRRHVECHAVTPGVTPVGHPPGVAAVVTAGVQGSRASALGFGSGSGPEGDPRGAPPSETRLKSAPPPPVADRPNAAEGQKPAGIEASAPLDRTSEATDGCAWRGPKHRAIADRIRRSAALAVIDADRFAMHTVSRHMGVSKPPELPWVLTAIDDCAADSDGLNLQPEPLQRKLRGYVDNARAPAADKAAEAPPGQRGPAYREDDTPSPKVTSAMRRANQARAAALVRGIGGGPAPMALLDSGCDETLVAAPLALPPIRQPMTEAELADKRRDDLARLAEFEAKTATGGKS